MASCPGNTSQHQILDTYSLSWYCQFCIMHIEFWRGTIINRNLYKIQIEKQFQKSSINQLLAGLKKLFSRAAGKGIFNYLLLQKKPLTHIGKQSTEIDSMLNMTVTLYFFSGIGLWSIIPVKTSTFIKQKYHCIH